MLDTSFTTAQLILQLVISLLKWTFTYHTSLSPLQVSGATRMSPGLLCPRLWSPTATSSPSSATSSTQWPSPWTQMPTTPGKTSSGALRACNCTRGWRRERWLAWTTVSSSCWFSSSWTSHRLLQVSVLFCDSLPLSADEKCAFSKELEDAGNGRESALTEPTWPTWGSSGLICVKRVHLFNNWSKYWKIY